MLFRSAKSATADRQSSRPRFAHRRLLTGLGRERDVPDRGLIQVRERLLPRGQERLGHPRVQAGASPARDDALGQLRPARLPGHVRVLRDVHHPDGQRDLLAARLAGHAPAVPALVQMAEGLLHLIAQAHPRAQQPGDVTVRPGPLAELGDAADGRLRHRRGARQRRAVPVRDPHGRRHQAQAGAEEGRHHLRPGGELVAEEASVGLAVGGAAGEVQQAGVEDCLLGVLVKPQVRGDPGADDRRPQAVLERLAHRQIGRQGQHAGRLREP